VGISLLRWLGREWGDGHELFFEKAIDVVENCYINMVSWVE